MPERVLELSHARVKWFLVMANDDGIIFGAEVGRAKSCATRRNNGKRVLFLTCW
jgi:hypothetical protein